MFGISDPAISLIVTPILIFCARVCDVTIGTIRIIFVSRGFKYAAPVLGFFEVLIWLIAIGQIMQHLTNLYNYIFYAAGFAVGTYVGMLLENKISLGSTLFRIVIKEDPTPLIESLKQAGFGVTHVPGEGLYGPVEIIHTVVRRRQLDSVLALIYRNAPNAFYSIEDVRHASTTATSPGIKSFASEILHQPLQLMRISK